MKTVLFILFPFLITCSSIIAQIPVDSMYFGFTPPGDSAIIFAPGIISLPGRAERTPNYLPDYSEFYFSTATSGGVPKVYSTKYTDDHWEIPSINPAFPDFACDLSITDSTLACFTSNEGNNINSNTDIWIIERENKVWGEPYKVPGDVNSSQGDWGACILKNKTIYVCKYQNRSDIFKYPRIDGDYPEGTRLAINSNESEWDPYIAEDESYIIFKSNRAGGYGDMDLYISYLKENGKYTNPKNLGDKINTEIHDDCGNLTPDGKYFMFARNNRATSEFDIYWVNVNFIDSLKSTNYVPYVLNRIPDQTVPVNTHFSFTIPDTTFFDDDEDDILTYSASLDNGDDLPGWLDFDSVTVSLSGTPPVTENLYIKITATDNVGASVSYDFVLIIEAETKVISNTIHDNITIYPIPSSQTIIINSEITTQIKNYMILDLNGKVMRQNKFDSKIMDVSGLNHGVYILKLQTDKGLINRKIVIE